MRGVAATSICLLALRLDDSAISLADHLFENLCRAIRMAVVAVPLRHLLERLIAFDLAGIPVQPFPVVADNLAHRVARRERDANSEAALRARCRRFDEIVLMAVVHAAKLYRITG